MLGHAATNDKADLSRWCLERNAYYDELRAVLPSPLVVAYEGLSSDPEGTLGCVLDVLGVATLNSGPRAVVGNGSVGLASPSASHGNCRSGTAPFSPLQKLHTRPTLAYVRNADEVRSWRSWRWDYDHESDGGAHCSQD